MHKIVEARVTQQLREFGVSVFLHVKESQRPVESIQDAVNEATESLDK